MQRWGTYSQAKFYLQTRGQTIDFAEALHQRLDFGLRAVLGAFPSDQKWVRVDRDNLDRFLFAPDDFVMIVGQDGLVPNVAKYLNGQLTCGINPDPGHYDGVLCRHAPTATAELLRFAATGQGAFKVEGRTMARSGVKTVRCCSPSTRFL